MKKIIKISIGLFSAVSLLTGCHNKDDILKIGKDNITKEALFEEMKQEHGEVILKKMAYEKILEKKYPVSDKQVEQRLTEYKNQGIDKYQDSGEKTSQKEKSLKKKIRYQLLIEEAIEANYKVNDQDLKTFYENWQPGIQVRHILFSNEASAKEGQEKLGNGESFKKLVEEYSIDVTTKSTGGLIENLTSGSIDPTFEATAFGLEKVGQVSEVIQSSFGYHLIELVKLSNKTTFEKDKSQVKSDYIKAMASEKDKIDILKKEVKEADLKVKDSFFKDSFLTN